MRLKVIACKVLYRELYYLSWNSKNIIDIQLMEQQLHCTPEKLRVCVQAQIDATEAEDTKYDAIILGYCLCSNGVVGLHSDHTPLVIARGHDCITLLLGSKKRYRDIFDNGRGGIYWYSPGWIEHSLQPGKERYEAVYADYVKRFGEENADYLMEMEQSWMREYSQAVYVDWPQLHHESYWKYTQECADFLHWECHMVEGNDSLMRGLLEGPWEDSGQYLVVPPGYTIQPTYDSAVETIPSFV